MRNKNRRREVLPQVTSPVATVAEKIPLVSVVMPMFNAAKFVTQTLESLLYQTMTDFEVVIVDDCSTDNSIEVVEGFRERFNGRLKLVRLPKNTGTPGLPRNVGIQLARGKYIAFLDCDDLYTKTALEEMSTLAEKFQADVVSIDGSFKLWGGEALPIDDPRMTDMNELTNSNNFKAERFFCDSSLTEPTLKPENFGERLRLFFQAPTHNYGVFSSFCKREFLIVNQIYFPKMPAGEDQVFNFNCLCLAKNFLRISEIFYIVRPRSDSVMREKISNPEKYFRNRVKAFNGALIESDKIMSRMPFFEKHPDYRYAVFEKFAFFRLNPTMKFYAGNPIWILDSIVKQEFHPDDAALSAYLFNTVNVYRLHIMKLQQELAALKSSK